MTPLQRLAAIAKVLDGLGEEIQFEKCACKACERERAIQKLKQLAKPAKKRSGKR